MMQDVSLAASFGRLLVVAVLMAAVLLLLKRTTSRGRTVTKRRSNRAIELVDRQSLGKTQSVAVLRVHDHTLVVGVTDHRVELLTTLEPALPTDDTEVRDDDLIDLSAYEVAGRRLDEITVLDDTERFFARLRDRSAR